MKITIKERPVAVFGAWEVYQDGTLKKKYITPTGKETAIEIYPDRLTEPDLILSLMADKVVTEWNQLMPAFMLACRLAGVAEVTIRTNFD